MSDLGIKNRRAERGLEIAATKPIRKHGTVYIVPSQSGGGFYNVNVGRPEPTCSCADFRDNAITCKHIYAVQFFRDRQAAKLEPPVESSAFRPTYPQLWPAYNAAQTNEKQHIIELLQGLCDLIDEPEQWRGRPRHRLRDAVFAVVMKVYLALSGRRAMTDMHKFEDDGFLTAAPSFNSVLMYMSLPLMTTILQQMILHSASLLQGIESHFAVDSSGFATVTYGEWIEKRYGTGPKRKDWLKANILVGCKTQIIVSAIVTDANAADAPVLPLLVEQASRIFDLEYVSADKAYTSEDNFYAVAAVGGVPFMPFKRSHKLGTPHTDLWEKLFHFFMLKREEFERYYHQRSNVETAFHMIKSKFGRTIRGKTPVAQQNELLCKLLCHNLCVLIHSIYELQLDGIVL